MHKSFDGRLVPRKPGESFKRPAYFGQAHYGDGSTFGESATNAVIVHQKDSAKFPTSGVSTTPIYENAVIYALYGGKYEKGIVYKIDTELFEQYGVTQFPVEKHAVKPSIPKDKEVILLAEDNDVLPREIVVEEIEV